MHFSEIWIKYKTFIHENAPENDVCEMAAMLSRGSLVKHGGGGSARLGGRCILMMFHNTIMFHVTTLLQVETTVHIVLFAYHKIGWWLIISHGEPPVKFWHKSNSTSVTMNTRPVDSHPKDISFEELVKCYETPFIYCVLIRCVFVNIFNIHLENVYISYAINTHLY